MSEKTKSQKRREQRKRAKERRRMSSVEASALGRWDVKHGTVSTGGKAGTEKKEAKPERPRSFFQAAMEHAGADMEKRIKAELNASIKGALKHQLAREELKAEGQSEALNMAEKIRNLLLYGFHVEDAVQPKAEALRLRAQVAELERIAAARLDELVDLRALELQHGAVIERLRARVLELEPLAEVGRRMGELPIAGHLRHHTTAEGEETWTITWKKGLNITGAPTLIGALRAAGIGEEVGHGP